MTTLLPATREIADVFTEEIRQGGGTVSERFDDGIRLFLRAVLTATDEVRPGDALRAGVALRTSADEILIHPYTFRQVCRNGAIMAQAIETRRIHRVSFSAPSEEIEQVLAELREAVQVCSSDEAFSTAASQLRSATEMHADLALNLLPMLGRGSSLPAELLTMIWGRFEDESDRSTFGLVNAVTSTARDTADPEMRWRLEELGGGIPARLRPDPTPSGARATRKRAGQTLESDRISRESLADVGA